MSEKTENKTASAKLGKFLENNRKPVIISFVIVLVLVIGFLCAEIIKTSVSKKDLAAVEGFYYELTAMSNEAEDSEITNKATECIENLAPYTKKGGIVGARANMLCADITYQQKNYAQSAEYWKAAAEKSNSLSRGTQVTFLLEIIIQYGLIFFVLSSSQITYSKTALSFPHQLLAS